MRDQKATYDGASKQNNSRRKPRIPRFLHSFCCCVWPSSQLREDRKTGGRCATVTTIPEDLITQVKQTSSINGVCAESASGNESYTVDDADAQDVTSGTVCVCVPNIFMNNW
ncbi:hypothetical protein AB6A40_006086 [Gnathostoma spinigerum]|uniref:Uncharacterized protein n=1 Tax=Gnathostoma spinigerum TaxID=75299 RepID=A0ABD6EJI6_9BILA